jgi:hypothetical protein
MTNPVKIDNPIVNKSTGSEILVAVFESSGRKFAAIRGTSGTNRHATSAPTAPAITLTSKLSKTNNRTTLEREAPIAIRKAISRRRPLKRTSKRFATLLQAISNTKQTAAKRVMNPARKFSVTS